MEVREIIQWLNVSSLYMAHLDSVLGIPRCHLSSHRSDPCVQSQESALSRTHTQLFSPARDWSSYLVTSFNAHIVSLFWNCHKEFSFIGTLAFIPCIDYEHQVILISNDDLVLISKNAV